MKPTARLLFLALGLTAGSAYGACGGTDLTGTDLQNIVANNLVCAYKDGQEANPNERWSSYHSGSLSGDLYEYARGAGDAVDPTKDVGSWALVDGSNADVSNAADAVKVRYTYDGDATYYWSIQGTGAPYEYCNGATLVAYAKAPVGAVTPGTTTGNACNWSAGF